MKELVSKAIAIGQLIWVFRLYLAAIAIGLIFSMGIVATKAWLGDPSAIWWACDMIGFYCPT